ncbi:hypothetical protein [Aquimarina algicola]|uniref:Uncharacterized protein n=1 Tax=Aquimarina algicola TaxID=2589995 RepID=A0A504J972_9FLAO|nr:hypothetical protein [Aquimarina algicola]TPN87427.1 hypothetical protein FHK87_07545 [Aquimarina algicola]
MSDETNEKDPKKNRGDRQKENGGTSNTSTIKRSKGSYQKEIVVDEKDNQNLNIKRRERGEYYFFEIPVNKEVHFHLKVIKASNMKATQENVYWVAQTNKNFKSQKWLSWTGANNKYDLHELLMNLNEGTIYGKKLLEDGSLNPKYVEYTEKNTNGVKKNYLPTNPYKSKSEKRELNDGVYFGNVTYHTDTLGEGIWLEGINYLPEFESQGAFIIAVGEPQILSFYVAKRVRKESDVDAIGIIDCDTEHVEKELIYGDILDLHLRLHNIINYTASIEVFCDDEPMDEYNKVIPLSQYQDIENPSTDYNLDIIDELLVDIRWANKSDHDEADDFEDSLQEYKMVLTLTPIKRKGKHTEEDTRPTITREVTFTVNYKGDFSLEEQEHQYVEQVVKVKQPPLVTQSYETCRYTELTISMAGYENPIILLQEQDNGSLIDNKTPYYEFVAGNNENKKEIIIDISSGNGSFTGVDSCENEISHKENKDHPEYPNNVFNTSSVQLYDYDKNYEDNIWGKFKEFLNTKNNIFGNVQPYSDEERAADQLKFTVAYPYNSYSEGTFLARYLTLQLSSFPIDISVQSCRYVRTPKFVIHPDVVWAMHFNYGVDEEDILYYNDTKVPLVTGYADYMSYLAAGLEWVNNKVKPFVEQYMIGDNEERKKGWDKVQEIIDEFVKESITKVALGFHARIDKERLINYSEMQPYKAVLNYYIFQMVLFSIAIDVLLIYLTRGKVAPGMQKAARVAGKFKKLKKRAEKFGEDYNLTFHMPKVSCNFGFHREQSTEKLGEVTRIIQYTLRADPLIAISSEYEFAPERLPKELKKFKVTALAEGIISFDINIQYDVLEGTFTLNNTAVHQEGGGGNVLKDGDIIQLEGKIALTLEGEAKVEGKWQKRVFKLFPIKVHTKAEGKVNLHSAAGITRRFGIDANKGPFLEDTLFFDGITGEYFQKVTVAINSRKRVDTNPTNKTTSIPKFGYGTASLGRMYIFEIFNPHKPEKYYKQK